MTDASIVDAIGLLRLNRPEVLNAINTPMIAEIEEALDRFEADEQVKAVVIVGTGRAFCVGTDLKEHAGDAEGRVKRMHRLVLRLVNYPKISVAALNGLALGGGLEIAMACTLRVAATAAKLGLPELTHGMMPAYGGTQLLPRLVGVGKALEIALTGEMLDAAEARAIGLVGAIVDDAQGAAIALAQRCTRWGGVAPGGIARAMLDGIDLPLEQGLELEAKCVMRLAASGEIKAGLEAFAARGR